MYARGNENKISVIPELETPVDQLEVNNLSISKAWYKSRLKRWENKSNTRAGYTTIPERWKIRVLLQQDILGWSDRKKNKSNTRAGCTNRPHGMTERRKKYEFDTHSWPDMIIIREIHVPESIHRIGQREENNKSYTRKQNSIH